MVPEWTRELAIAFVIMGFLVAFVYMVLLPQVPSLMVQAGLISNTCSVQYDDSGAETCRGEFNTCEAVMEEGLCEAAGCTWNGGPEECVNDTANNPPYPSCAHLSVSECQQMGG